VNPIKREVTIGDCRLILGDCLDVLPMLGKVDAVVTDPPYGVLEEAWDDMDLHDLAAFTMTWVGMVRRMSEMSIVFFGEKTRKTINDILYLVYPEIRQVIWSKGGGTVASDGMFYSYESAYICRSSREAVEIVGPKSSAFAAELRKAREAAGLSRGGLEIIVRGKKTGLCYRWEEGSCIPTDEQLARISTAIKFSDEALEALAEAKLERDRNVAANLDRTKAQAARSLDVLRYPSPSGIGHPTSKPIGLMMELCRLADGVSILDPFLGSGSTGVAAARLGRPFIGIERDPDYFEIAVQRVRKAYAQPDMFVTPKPAVPVQQPLFGGEAA